MAELDNDCHQKHTVILTGGSASSSLSSPAEWPRGEAVIHTASPPLPSSVNVPDQMLCPTSLVPARSMDAATETISDRLTGQSDAGKRCSASICLFVIYLLIFPRLSQLHAEKKNYDLTMWALHNFSSIAGNYGSVLEHAQAIKLL